MIRRPPRSTQPTTLFPTRRSSDLPHALLHNLKHNKVLHERVVIATVASPPVPRIDEAERVAIEHLGGRFYRTAIRYGFMEQPDVPAALASCAARGFAFEPMATSYFLGRETVVPEPGGEMAYWCESLFATLYRNARTATDFFRLPPNQVVELGTRVTL
jgi:KUP system potassium uptake protein